MTRKQLEQQRERVEAQLRWAVLHGGDQELVDLLRVESDRLGGLVLDRLITTAPETVRAGGRPIQVVRMMITEAGRRAIAGSV